MKRLLIYSHDTFGLGNIRRIMNIATYLHRAIPDISILIVTGSPMIQSFRIPKGIDYIKLPCLSRTARDGYSAKYLDSTIGDVIRLRSDLILSAVLNFKPDVMLVDKKPYGVKHELRETLNLVKGYLPKTRTILLLRDILDAPATTTKVWEDNAYFEAVNSVYDLVLVLGTPEIFDPRAEYGFPVSTAEKVEFCGYIEPQSLVRDRDTIRAELHIERDERLILVTPGGGEDGNALVRTYIQALQHMPVGAHVRSLIVTGPEMSEPQRNLLHQSALRFPSVKTLDFTNDLPSYMNASDLVVSMGGYNTVCEILSLKKRAIIVPRVRPVEEQWIRAERMARLGLLTTIHPDSLTPQDLLRTVLMELESDQSLRPTLDLTALPTLTSHVSMLLDDTYEPVPLEHLSR
ncbi:MAG: glycosyltransferase [Nitrospira sp. CG24A]|nr:MAG: glycosyltransferase [Nitrospira sp. CG24A]